MFLISYRHITIATLLGLALGLMSCRTAGVEDIEAPAVQIVSPASATTFTSGDTIFYHIILSDNDQLHDVLLSVYETDSGYLRWTKVEHPHTDTMTFSGDFSLEAKEKLNVTLRVEASDHHENLVTHEIPFSIDP